MKKHISWKLFYCLSILLPTQVHATSGQPILSEIYAAPASTEQEWIELYNPTQAEISLTGFTLWDEQSTPSVIYTATTEIIPPLGYLALTIPTSKLNNSGDGVQLRGPDSTIIDFLSFISTQQGFSWQRTALDSHEIVQAAATRGIANSQYPLPTITTIPPDETATNSTAVVPSATPSASLLPTPTPSLAPTPAPTQTPNPSPLPIAYESLHLSEILSCPSSGQEWVELYNSNTSPVTFSGLTVQDESGNGKTIAGTIPSTGYTTFSWSGSLLNNSGDTLDILTPQGDSIAHAEFSSCTTGKSFIFIAEPAPGNWTLSVPTPGAPNTFTTPTTLSSPVHTLATSTQTNTPEDTQRAQILGVVSEEILPLNQEPPRHLLAPNLISPNTPTQRATHSAAITATDPAITQTTIVSKGLLLFTCIGSFTGGTLLMYEKIKQAVHPLA